MEWIEKLKVGDKVAVMHGYGRENAAIKTVEKVGKLHVIVSGTKYRKRSGYEVGGSKWFGSSICEPTPELLEDIERERLVSSIGAIRHEGLRKLSVASLRQIRDLMFPATKPEVQP